MTTPTDRTRIVYFAGGHHVGGMESHLLHLIAGLDRDRFDPIVCTLAMGPAFAERLATLDLCTVDVGTPRLTRPAAILRLRRFLTLLRRERPRLLHTYGYTCDVVGPALARLVPGVRTITTRRGEDTSPRHQAMRSRVNRVTARIVCVSEETRAFTERAESLHGTPVDVIPNGVVIPPPTTREPSPRLRIGTLGTVKPIKGTDLLVDAFLGLDASRECELVIGGRTDRSAAWARDLVARVEASPWRERVRFAGYQDDPAAFYPAIDVFVLPSRSEGMSNSLLEAMAFGLPVIATDVGSNASVLRGDGGAGGLVVRPEVHEIRRALERMLDEPEARARWASNARRTAETRHSLAAMVSAHEALYERVLAS